MSVAPFLIVCASGFFALTCCVVSLMLPSPKGQILFSLHRH